MKVFTVFGITQSGKTTTIENIIKELKKRQFSVGSVKDIHFESFTIETKGTNTDRHHKAGSDLVTARGLYETDILFKKRLSIDDILKFYNHDFVVLEGVRDCIVPKIITAHDIKEIDGRLDEGVFAISGRVANEIKEYKGLPVINAIKNIKKLVDLIEEKVYEKLPNFPIECCNECGYGCDELGGQILKGEATREDCVIKQEDITLIVDGKEIDIVPFVQKILLNAVMGVVGELEGCKKSKRVVVKIGNEN